MNNAVHVQVEVINWNDLKGKTKIVYNRNAEKCQSGKTICSTNKKSVARGAI